MITNFHLDNTRFLSNFYQSPVTYDGIPYRNAEAAFQAQKCMTREERRTFAGLSGADAKKFGRRVQMRPDWDRVKLQIMEEVLRAKFQNAALRSMLLATGNELLIEGNSWGDTFWGVDIRTNRGENHLGRLLMKIRSELKCS